MCTRTGRPAPTTDRNDSVVVAAAITAAAAVITAIIAAIAPAATALFAAGDPPVVPSPLPSSTTSSTAARQQVSALAKPATPSPSLSAQAPSCAGWPTTLEAPETTTEEDFNVSVDVCRPPTEDHTYVLIVQLDDQGRHKTVNTYPKVIFTDDLQFWAAQPIR